MSGSTTTISGISGADKIFIILDVAGSTSANVVIRIRINGDTGSNYYVAGAGLLFASTYSATNMSRNSQFSTGIDFVNTSNNDTSDGSGYVSLIGCNSSGIKMYHSVGAANTSSGSSQTHIYSGGFWNNAATVTSISINTSGGTFDEGVVYVYTSA